MRQIIVGWGNPIAGDDGLGCASIERLAARLAGRPDVDLVASARSAMRIAEEILGYDRAIIVDAQLADGGADGVCRRTIRPAELADPTGRAGHDGSLITALRALHTLRAERLPGEVVLLSAPIGRPVGWAEGLSPAAERAADALAAAALQEVEEVPVA